MPEADAYARADGAARAAAALSPTSAEAQRALAFIAFWWRQDRVGARRAFARAPALGPGDLLTHHWFATALLANGEFRASLHEIEVARELDPTAAPVLADQALIRYVAGRRAEGLAALRALARDQPDSVSPHRMLSGAALFEARADEFLAETEATAWLRGDAAALADVGRWGAPGPGATAVEAAMLQEAEASAAHGGGWFRVAQPAAVRGRREEA